MKINVGCGRHVLEGWMNVDLEASPNARRPPDIIGPADKIDLPDGVADELMAIHLLEHFYEWQVPAVLAEWRRLLKPGGLLILELPDLVKCCRNLLKLLETGSVAQQNQMAMWGIYGDPGTKNPLMGHHWGWTPDTLGAALRKAGFEDLRWPETMWHPAGRKHRDMRVEARKSK